MPCPYAEKRGAVVFCTLIGKKVNPLTHPCLSKKYTKCRYYQQYAERKVAEESIRAQEVAASSRSEESAAEKPPAPRKTRGLKLDGSPAYNCLECIYYGEHTKTCLLLGVEVKDPYNPPCSRM